MERSLRKKYSLILYLPNRPDVVIYRNKKKLKNLESGAIQSIISLTGNHWRKIFSIFAKISFGITDCDSNSWQEYRDEELLSKTGQEAINFNHRIEQKSEPMIHIISGKKHLENFDLSFDNFKKVDDFGRILKFENIYLTPYFDYRQFPNDLVGILIADIESS